MKFIEFWGLSASESCHKVATKSLKYGDVKGLRTANNALLALALATAAIGSAAQTSGNNADTARSDSGPIRLQQATRNAAESSAENSVDVTQTAPRLAPPRPTFKANSSAIFNAPLAAKPKFAVSVPS